MDIVFFIIFISMLAVAVLTLFAFFPIKVSWFYYREKVSLREEAAPRRSNPPAHAYTALNDDAFDDPEL
jgi:hypothetical protein